MIKRFARWIIFDLEFKPLWAWARKVLFRRGDK